MSIDLSISLFLDLIFSSSSFYFNVYGNAGRFVIMVRQASSIVFIFLRLYLVLFNKAESKSGGGHYSSQRTLSSGSGGSHASLGGNQFQNPTQWSHSWLPSDINTWYDYGM